MRTAIDRKICSCRTVRLNIYNSNKSKGVGYSCVNMMYYFRRKAALDERSATCGTVSGPLTMSCPCKKDAYALECTLPGWNNDYYSREIEYIIMHRKLAIRCALIYSNAPPSIQLLHRSRNRTRGNRVTGTKTARSSVASSWK